MKKILLLISTLVLVGCNDSYKEHHFPVLPAELVDCKFFQLDNTQGMTISVARCPNSTTATTYQSGKTRRTTVVIDGVTYEAKE